MANLELAKKRLETAILRLEALVGGATAAGPLSAAAASGGGRSANAGVPPSPAVLAENAALREHVDEMHQENVRLRQSMDRMGQRLDQIIARLDEVVVGSSRDAEA